jgi:hyperosmotically inducible protein
MKSHRIVRLKKLGAAFGCIALLAACAPVEGRETTGQYVDDATISTKVRSQLIEDQALRAFDIHVETMQDVVQLSGFVDSAQQKSQAERIARGINGVRNVRNDIVVRNG